MKILMTADTVGGVWTYAVQLADALRSHGVRIALATAGAPLSPDQHAAVARLPHVRLYESRFKLEWMQEPWEDVASAGRWLQEIADDFRPDVVHLNDYSHAARDWPVPVLTVGHSCVLSWFRAVRGHEAGCEWDRYREQVRAGLQRADLVVAPTQVMLDSLNHDYGPLRRCRVILNGRDAGCEAVGNDRIEKESLVLSAGRLWDEAKNFAALADAAEAIPWPVCVAGDGRHPDGGTVEFPHLRMLGRLDARQMEKWFRRASIYALPAKYEPFGLTPLEAALAGCALVLGDIPTLREVWGNAAVFVPPDDAAALAEAVNKLIEDAERRRHLAARAALRACRLTASRMADAYLATYGELLTSCRPRSRSLAPVGGA